MSGGTWEYVMENYNDIVADSGFISMPESKYYNKYTSNDPMTACNGSECLSHSLSEASGWYGDYHNMVSEQYPWLVRGGYFGNDIGAGVFSFSRAVVLGAPGSNLSFRLVLSPSL